MQKSGQKSGGRKLLGEMLIDAGMIDEIQLTVALGAQNESGLRLGKQLLKLGFVEEGDLALVLKDEGDMGVPLPQRKITREALAAVPEAIAFKYMVVPLAVVGKSLVLAVPDPNDLKKLDELSFKLSKNIHPVRAFEWDIESALLKFYKGFSDDEIEMLTNVSSTGQQYKDAQWSVGDEVLLDESSVKTETPGRPAPVTRPAPVQSPAQAKTPARPARRPAHQEPAPRPQDSATDVDWESILEHTSHAWDKPVEQKKRSSKVLSDAAINLKNADIIQVIVDLLIDKNLLTEKELVDRLSELAKRQNGG